MQDKDKFNEFINELIDKNDILEVVRGYVDLTRKGNSYWGRCPFHHEKTASFHVEERLKIYKCFGCGAAGNVIKFVQEIESVSFMEAVKILADRVGMKVPQFSHKSEENLGEKKQRQERHYNLVAVAARYYHNALVHNENMMFYLSSHGIDAKTITAYGLGYSPNHFGIVQHLKGLGYDDQEIEDAGVCYTSEDDKFKDVMAGRIVCPHINAFGKVVGFAGSTRSGETIYTKNTDIFRADSEVFGTHLLKAIKIEEGIDHLIVTSTPINAVVLRGKGHKKVVSIMGESVSSRQARALMRYTDKFTMLFSDVASGKDKDFAGFDSLVQEGASVKVATLCEHVSAVDAVEKKLFDRLMTRVKRAKSLLEYQFDLIAKKYDLKSDEGKDAFLREAKDYVLAIKERSKQEPYISVLAKIAGVQADSIRNAFYQDVSAIAENTAPKKVTKKKGKTYNAIISLFALMHAGYKLGEDIEEYLESYYKEYYIACRDGKSVELTQYFNDEEIAKINDIDTENASNAKLLKDCLKILKDDYMKRKQDAIVNAIAEETDTAKRNALMNELNELIRQKKELK